MGNGKEPLYPNRLLTLLCPISVYGHCCPQVRAFPTGSVENNRREEMIGGEGCRQRNGTA